MQPYLHNLFMRLQKTDAAGPPPNPGLIAGAAALSRLYGLGAWLRRTLYSRGLLRRQRLPAPVVSVGNLTVGGTGKTPVVAYLAGLWRDRGKRVVILSRGYGGRTRTPTRLSDGKRLYYSPPWVGEEPYWLARTLPGVPVFTGTCRFNAGMAAWQEFKPDLFLLDDGFQHFQLHRDLDLVLLDAGSPFGNGFLLPRGPLREPLSSLNAAHAIILTRFDPQRHQATLTTIQKRFPDHMVLTATISPVGVTIYPGGQTEPPQAVGGQTFLAFAGLARPEVFQESLQKLGVHLKELKTFPDHHVYTSQELEDLTAAAKARGAEALITTAKDWARLGERWDGEIPLWVLEVEARLSDPEKVLSFAEHAV